MQRAITQHALAVEPFVADGTHCWQTRHHRNHLSSQSLGTKRSGKVEWKLRTSYPKLCLSSVRRIYSFAKPLAATVGFTLGRRVKSSRSKFASWPAKGHRAGENGKLVGSARIAFWPVTFACCVAADEEKIKSGVVTLFKQAMSRRKQSNPKAIKGECAFVRLFQLWLTPTVSGIAPFPFNYRSYYRRRISPSCLTDLRYVTMTETVVYFQLMLTFIIS